MPSRIFFGSVSPTADQNLTPDPIAIPIIFPDGVLTSELQLTPDPIAIPIILPAGALSLFEQFGSMREMDPLEWDGNQQFYLEVYAKTSNPAKPLKAYLVDETDTDTIEDSLVSVASASPDRARSTAFSIPAGTKEYKVIFGGEVGETYTMYDAVVILDLT